MVASGGFHSISSSTQAAPSPLSTPPSPPPPTVASSPRCAVAAPPPQRAVAPPRRAVAPFVCLSLAPPCSTLAVRPPFFRLHFLRSFHPGWSAPLLARADTWAPRSSPQPVRHASITPSKPYPSHAHNATVPHTASHAVDPHRPHRRPPRTLAQPSGSSRRCDPTTGSRADAGASNSPADCGGGCLDCTKYGGIYRLLTSSTNHLECGVGFTRMERQQLSF